MPYELIMLSQIHPDFFSAAHFAVDVHKNILVGRPYGGTAILYRRELSNLIEVLDTGDPRLCAK